MDKKDFKWTDVVKTTLKKLKIALAEVLALASPGEMLTFYLSTFLQGAEIGYPDMEKLVLFLFNILRRLRRYFLVHPIEVLTNATIHQVLLNQEKSVRLAKWIVELEEHEIDFKPRTSIKAHAFAYFITETTSNTKITIMEESNNNGKQENQPDKEPWVLHTNGSPSMDGVRASLILTSPT